MKIPLAQPQILEADIDAVAAVLRSSRLSQGPVMHKFEDKLAEYLGVSHAVAVNSGTSALQLALHALNIQAGDEVILPSFSFMAVANAVLSARAVPVFVDIAQDQGHHRRPHLRLSGADGGHSCCRQAARNLRD